jgi:gliding motility-associated-like protein
MDNTFDHGANYTGIPSSDPDASPCDPSTLDNGSTNSQGHVSIWNEMLTNQEFHDDYINRWQDLSNGGLSCDFMIYVLDSMVAVIEPEMPRQIATWGGTYAAWQSNVTDLRDFILARCDSMNSGFVDCDTAITGIFNVTVEIVGVGEVEMSNSNIINPLSSGWTDQRFGGIDLPFKVVSGTFDHWEVISATAYVYDPNVDTLVLDLQSDVLVKAYFGESRGVVFDIDPDPLGTTTSIDINGTMIGAFPYSMSPMVGDNISLIPNIDALYGFDSWSSDSNFLSPSTLTENINFTVTYADTITLHLYQKPTMIYEVIPTGTTTSIDINGVNVSVFPHSETVLIDDINTINPIIDPAFGFGYWSANFNTFINGNSINNSFYGEFSDTIRLNLSTVTAFISGNETICDNAQEKGIINVSFTGTAPFTFSYSINGISQPLIEDVYQNPYLIRTKVAGIYTLNSYYDAVEIGQIDGEGILTVLESPIANFTAYPDTLTILNTTVSLTDKSTTDQNLISWEWDFGDNTALDNSQNPYHTYSTTTGLYDVSLIVADDIGCSDTISKTITITDDYWIWVPNSFTPDLDGKNDKFCIAYNGIREATFTFNVFDRFSNLVYSTSNIQDLDCENGWDGKHQSTGNELPMGVYIYKMYYQDYEGWKHQEIKELILIR